ncbi:MAG: hypothetical protein ACTSVC_01490 [Promethearchaeota archaeon]
MSKIKDKNKNNNNDEENKISPDRGILEICKNNIDISKKALKGLIDPMKIDINKRIQELSQFSKTINDEISLDYIASALDYLNQVQNKQLEIIKGVINDNYDLYWTEYLNKISSCLADKKKFIRFKKLCQNLVAKKKFRFPFANLNIPFILEKEGILTKNTEEEIKSIRSFNELKKLRLEKNE